MFVAFFLAGVILTVLIGYITKNLLIASAIFFSVIFTAVMIYLTQIYLFRGYKQRQTSYKDALFQTIVGVSQARYDELPARPSVAAEKKLMQLIEKIAEHDADRIRWGYLEYTELLLLAKDRVEDYFSSETTVVLEQLRPTMGNYIPK